MADDDPFKKLLAEVAVALKRKGFQRTKNTFWSSGAPNWAIIQFQRSTKSTAQVTSFTINLGTASKALLGFFGKPDRMPTIDECHWRQRIGFTLPTAEDRWWNLTQTEVSSVAREVIEALCRFGLPAIQAHLSDGSLKKEWGSGCAPGLTETDRLKFLSALLKIEGSEVESRAVADSLRTRSEGTATVGLTRTHLERLASEKRGV